MNPFEAFVGLVFLGIAALFVFAALLRWLWNISMPDVFNLRQITYWQAFRFLLISFILFGGSFVKFGF